MRWGYHPLAGESGANDPSVLPMRHTLECPRQATFVVSALQRHVVGAVGNRGTPAARRRSGLGPGPQTAPRLPLGYRWIAVRPGPPPPPRRRRRPLGPTPRYLAIPRWGLVDRVDQDGGPDRAQRQAPPAERVRTAFFVSAVALGAAALVHLLRYLLLVINRNTLLNWLVADAAALLSVLASLAAIAAVMTTARWC